MPQRPDALLLMDQEVFPLVYGEREHQRLERLFAFPAPPLTAASLDSFGGSLESVQAVFSGWGMPVLSQALLDRLPSCRIVFHAGGTVRTFATDAAWARGIRFTSAADANAIPVAEYTLAMIILCLKHAWKRMEEMREGRPFRHLDPLMPGAYGTTVGLLSLSRTGRKVAERLRELQVKVIAYDPVVDPAVARELGAELRPLAEVFSNADVISCHLPLLPETRHVLRGRHFAAMKPGASFINTARGGVICEEELCQELARRPDLYAVLDVLQEEPPPPSSPFRLLPNVVLTPHIAGSLGPECRRMGRAMVDEAERFVIGEALQGEILPGQFFSLA